MLLLYQNLLLWASWELGVNTQSERSNSPTHSVSEYRYYTEFFVIPPLRHSVILGMDFFTNHKVSLHMGDKIMTIDHNGITKIPLISNDAGCARVAQTTKIPASSVKNVRIRVSNTRSNSCALLQPINLLNRYNVLLPHCLINNANPTSQITLWQRNFFVVTT